MRPLQIALYVPGLAFNPDTLSARSLGGSETAGLSMAKALRDRGHRIYLFCTSEQYGSLDGMQWAPLQDFPGFVNFIQHDVCVVQRLPGMFRNRIQSKMNVCWQHDLALARYQGEVMSAMWNVDKLALVSKFMVDQYLEVMGACLKDSVMWQTRNGIDLSLFPKVPGKRDPKLLVYSARPERGLDYLLDRIFPKLLERDPELRLVLSAYDNPAPELQPYYDAIGRRVAELGDRVVVAGALPKPELYRLYQSARVYVYPTPSPMSPRFREVSCISVMECMAAGLPFVGSHLGALPETLAPGAGTLIEGAPGSEGYDERFVEAVMVYLQDDAAWQDASEAGPKAAQDCQWSAVAQEWEDCFTDYIGARHVQSSRLETHLAACGDAAVHACLKSGNMNPKDVVADNFPAAPGPAIPVQAAVALQWLRGIEGLRNCFDYGQFPEQARAQLPGVIFHGEPNQGGKYDAAVIINRLEYSAEPWKELETAVRHVRSGGWVIFVTPCGPFRAEGRLWDLSWSDLVAMCGHMDKFDLFSQLGGADENTADPHTWMYARFQVGGTARPQPIDVKDKLAMTVPRESLSATIIAGGAGVEKNLHWCLGSVAAVADEIVIGDAGMGAEALRIACQYPNVRLVHCPNPLEAGFDAARNTVLEQATGDWILWIDTDEALVGGEFMTKYLRPSIYDGFSIRQHHFGIDIQYQPDLPVRLFRRAPETRFFGRIHEHPEKGLNNGPGTVVLVSDVHIMHIGYSSEKVRQRRFWRNRPLVEKDEKDYPDRLLQKHFIMRDMIIMSNYELATNGGQVTQTIKEQCEKAIDLWRKHFKGGCPLVGVDSLQYYSRACQILNIGVEVAINIAAGRDGFGAPINGAGMRFADQDDLMSELKLRAEQSVGPLLREDF